MMKAAILTFPNSPSHGASLQMYALYKTIENLGHEACIINYETPHVIHNRNKMAELSFKQKLRTKLINNIAKILLPHSKENFRSFEAELIKNPAIPTDATSDLKEIAKQYDRLIVGSDQVWNPDVTGNDMNFYFKFCDDSAKKAAYAPSFGRNDVLEEEKEEIAELLNDFTYLSAREKRGSEIVKALTGKDVPVVLDPTFLVDKQTWEKKAVTPPKKYGDYVLFYNIKPSPGLRAKAKNFADRHGLKLVVIGGRLRDKFDKSKFAAFGVGPAEFLGLIRDAKYVFTNSFHGMALSIELQKNLYVEYSTDTNSRLVNMIEMLELDECVVTESFTGEKPIDIDYAAVEQKLAPIRQASLDYLKEILK